MELTQVKTCLNSKLYALDLYSLLCVSDTSAMPCLSLITVFALVVVAFFFFFFLAFLHLHCCTDFSLVAERGNYSLVAVHWLLNSTASLVVVTGSWGHRLQ